LTAKPEIAKPASSKAQDFGSGTGANANELIAELLAKA
jgi:hypothetical protein